MKRIFALLGACALLGIFSAPAMVQAAPVAIAAVDSVIVGTANDNIEWTSGNGTKTLSAGAIVVASTSSSGVTVTGVNPNGSVVTDNISWTSFASIAPNISWGGGD
ncbi:hypothetical protein [Armatimonas rosea]|uniref:Uncharacterized protein n=1 Tax=Armatimonas rosea TaxID=685828 RepID=A0A7W9W540_ARMRO|nr:hypothetical protein [Armatimonas rosea]MBB6050029.1 hypothetical protein [Armatimonas rosea]